MSGADERTAKARERSYTDQDWKEAAELYGNALKEIETWKARALAAESEHSSVIKEAREECARIAEAEHALGTNGIGIARAIREGSTAAIRALGER
jgi:arginine/lysine/ornithine decarboxylase